MVRLCSIDGCDSKHYGKGWCSRHWQRWRSYGDPLAGGSDRPKGATVEERFDTKWRFTMYCWEWTAATGGKGYGDFRINRRTHRAHKVAYERWVGPIPAGMFVDHRCHNHACVNPMHLRLVTPKQNGENRRGAQPRNGCGYRGVSSYETLDGRRFSATVIHNRAAHSRHGFITAEAANEAAIELRNELYTHNDLDRRP